MLCFKVAKNVVRGQVQFYWAKFWNKPSVKDAFEISRKILSSALRKIIVYSKNQIITN